MESQKNFISVCDEEYEVFWETELKGFPVVLLAAGLSSFIYPSYHRIRDGLHC